MNKYIDSKIEWDGDTWRVVNTGAVREDAYGDDLVYLHLASMTRSSAQRNGAYPIQMGDWVPISVLRSATVEVVR